ncbi:MAG: autotransporter assembly complex family protein [Leptothrix sp. (in: b-proteobacteria)]
MRQLVSLCLIGIACSGLPALAQTPAGANAPAPPAELPASSPTATMPPEDDSTDAHFVRWSLSIEAPETLLPLLQKHLDLARFERLAQSEQIARSELTRLLAATPAQVRSLLETEGYFSAESQVDITAVTGEPSTSNPGSVPLMQVRLRVQAGQRTSVRAVQIDISGALQTSASKGDAAATALIERLRQQWSLPVGRPYAQADWSEAKLRALALLRNEGYASPTWQHTQAQVDVSAQAADLQLDIDSGPLYRFGAVHYQGLDHVEVAALEALLTFEPGEPMREQPLIDYQERLVRTGLFDTVSVTVEAEPAQADATAVIVRVGERSLQQATLGVGVSDSTGPRVTLEHLHQAIFGLGWQAKSKFQLGQTAQLLSVDLTSHPHPGPYRNLIGAALSRSQATGLEVSGEKLRIGRTQDTERVERLYYVEWQRALTRPQAGGPISDDVSSGTLNYQWVWRELDHPILPTRGFSTSAEVGAGHSFHTTADSGWFGRATARITGYWPFGQSLYGQARLQLGEVFPTSVSVPYTLLFRAGGDDSVRGYGYQTLGPTDASGTAIGGRVLATSSLEVARPISAKLPSLWLATFVDAGGAAPTWRDYHASLGYGVGLRWRSPVGPLRVDLAYGADVHRVRLHFTVGITF